MTKTAEAKVQKELDALEHMTTAELVEKSTRSCTGTCAGPGTVGT